MEDYQIIELYFQRSDMAITETAVKYGSYCQMVAQNVLHNMEDSEECVNDTWWRAWNSIPPQRPGFLRMFLAKITRNLAIDLFRSKSRQKRGGGVYDLALEELSEVILAQNNVEEQLAAKELEESIRRFVAGLSERDGNVFLRRYFYFETTSCIAEKYGIRESNVLLILSRTREKLRKHLLEEGYVV